MNGATALHVNFDGQWRGSDRFPLGHNGPSLSMVAPAFFTRPERIHGLWARMTRKGRKRQMNDTIGIDISKETLDAYWLSKRKHRQFSNSKTGMRTLIGWIQRANVSLVIFEATGVYHRLLETCLATHSIPFARVNPRQARRFAEGAGTLAKTDRVDAAMLSRMGSLLELKADKPKSETLHNLKEMETARQALIKDRTAAKARQKIATYPLLKKQINRRLQQVERDLVQISAAIEAVIAADKMLSQKADILISIPGIAKITAYAMLTEMPELGNLSGKQAASLAGLAPISRQSGNGKVKNAFRVDAPVCVKQSIYLLWSPRVTILI